MTDNEIIKALGFCKNVYCNGDCPLSDDSLCAETLARNTLDLIQRQQAEIDRLKKENDILSQNSDTAFQDGLNEAQDLYAEQIKDEIKAEAVKEFADRIVEQLEEKKTKFSFPKHCKSMGVCPSDKTCSECIVEKFVEDIIAIVKGAQNE